jgi:hypothetical protein
MTGKVVEVDNRSPNDNWIINKAGQSVTVACQEMFGSFALHLAPGEKKRITYDVKANVYPQGDYSYDDLRYEIGRKEKWEVRRTDGELVLVRRGRSILASMGLRR